MPGNSRLPPDGMQLPPGTGVPASSIALRFRRPTYAQRCAMAGREPSSELDQSDFECEREVAYFVISQRRARSRSRARRETEAMASADRQ